MFFRTGARFSIRVSAVEVVGRSENLKDLLQEQSIGNFLGIEMWSF
jgi:kinesin family protein 26